MNQDVRHSVEAQKVIDAYANSAFSAMLLFVLSIVLSIGLWSHIPHSTIANWLTLNIISIAVHFYFHARFQDESERDFDPGKWKLIILISFTVRGLIFGSAGIFLFSHDPTAQTILTVTLAGLVSGAISSYHMMRRVAIMFSAVFVLPLTYSLFTCESGAHTTLGALSLLYFASMVGMSFRFNKIYIDGMALKVKNESLLNALTMESMEKDRINKELQKSIGELKRTEGTLKHSEEKYRALFENSPHSILLTDPNSARVIDCNDKVNKTLGYSRDELLSMTIPKLEAKETPEETRAHFEALLKSGHETFETRMRRKDGGIVEILASVDIINMDGKPMFLGSFQDITEIKRTQENLRQSMKEKDEIIKKLDMLYRAIESIQVGVTICDADRNIVYVNEADARMHGYSVCELMGQQTRLYTGKAPDSPYAALSEINLKNGWTRESVNARKDGSQFPVLLSSAYITDEDGQPNALVTVCEDLTEIKRAQEEVARSRAFLDGIINSTDEPIMVIGPDYRILMMNRSAERHAHMEGDGCGPMLCHKVSHGLDSPCASQSHRCPLDEVIANRSSYTEMHVHTDAEGRERYMEVLASPMLNPDGTVYAVVESIRDLTEYISITNDLRRALGEKEMLIKEVHHRVKNNLMIIQSLLSLQQAEPMEAAARHALDESRARVRAIGMIHERLYKSSNLSTIEFSEYLESLARALFESYSVSDRGITLRIDVPSIKLDVESILPCGLIVNELLTNALKYAFPSGGGGEIFVGVETDEKLDSYLVVRDNGVGLPAGFDPMQSSSLGMQIVHSLCVQIGAEPIIRSGDSGTEFRALLLKHQINPLEWNDSKYLTRVGDIDAQHKELHAEILRLRDAIESERHEEGITSLIPMLVNYVDIHFRTEEDYMDKYAFPGAGQHKAVHKDFVDSVGAMTKAITGGKRKDSIKLYHFLVGWLKEHIGGYDMELGRFLAGKGVSTITQTDMSAGSVAEDRDALVIEDDRLAQISLGRFFAKNGYTHHIASSGSDAIEALRSRRFRVIVSDCILPDTTGAEIVKRAMELGVGAPFIFLTGINEDEVKAATTGANVIAVLQKPIDFNSLRSALKKAIGEPLN